MALSKELEKLRRCHRKLERSRQKTIHFLQVFYKRKWQRVVNKRKEAEESDEAGGEAQEGEEEQEGQKAEEGLEADEAEDAEESKDEYHLAIKYYILTKGGQRKADAEDPDHNTATEEQEEEGEEFTDDEAEAIARHKLRGKYLREYVLRGLAERRGGGKRAANSTLHALFKRQKSKSKSSQDLTEEEQAEKEEGEEQQEEQEDEELDDGDEDKETEEELDEAEDAEKKERKAKREMTHKRLFTKEEYQAWGKKGSRPKLSQQELDSRETGKSWKDRKSQHVNTQYNTAKRTEMQEFPAAASAAAAVAAAVAAAAPASSPADAVAAPASSPAD